MRKSAILMAGFLLLASACGGEAADTTAATTTTRAPTTTTTLPERSVAVVALDGDVATTGGPAPTELGPGDEVEAGDGASIVLLADDGTTIVVPAGSTVAITSLAWDDGAPSTVLTLVSGSVAAVRDESLPGGATFEIEAPGFTTGLTGSAVGATYLDDGAEASASCLFGDCYVRDGGGTTTLAGNEWLDTSDGAVSTKDAFTAAQRRIWAQVLAALREAGGGIDACTCDDRALRCTGTVEVPYFPACPDDTTCECEGPDLICRDGRSFPDDQQCMADMTPLAAVLVPEFTATYGCVEARTYYKVLDSRPGAEVVFRPYEDEASSCTNILPSYPVTYSIPGPNADGVLAGTGSFAGGSEYDFLVVDAPDEGMQGALGPRRGEQFTIYGRSYSSGSGSTTITGGDTDAVMTRTGTTTISVLGRDLHVSVYEGSFTGSEKWEAGNGVTASVQYAGTITIWLDVQTGLELRREVEAFYTGCSNCTGFVGLRERLEITELIDTNQPLG